MAKMFEVWGSAGGALKKLARFRGLDDALSFVARERQARSLAVRTPEGRWYRDPASGRAILGPDTSALTVAPVTIWPSRWRRYLPH